LSLRDTDISTTTEQHAGESHDLCEANSQSDSEQSAAQAFPSFEYGSHHLLVSPAP
jgi:hypothetical protein